MYFIANWKMYGDVKSLKTLSKVIRFSKLKINNNFKLIYCPPYTLLNLFSNMLKKTNIEIGAQNCHESENYGSYTGSINARMLKDIGVKYIILGHSENRKSGEDNFVINKKIKTSIKMRLKIIFCIGETLQERKKKITKKVLNMQISEGLKNIKNLQNILFAYEPIWSIGTGKIPKNDELERNVIFIKSILNKRFKMKKPRVLYGGSVSQKNITDLKKINVIDGFLVGGASQNANKFIDIVKKTFI